MMMEFSFFASIYQYSTVEESRNVLKMKMTNWSATNLEAVRLYPKNLKWLWWFMFPTYFENISMFSSAQLDIRLFWLYKIPFTISKYLSNGYLVYFY